MIFLTGKRKFHCRECDHVFRAERRRTARVRGEVNAGGARAAEVLG
jgi:hypothetical protein